LPISTNQQTSYSDRIKTPHIAEIEAGTNENMSKKIPATKNNPFRCYR